MKQSLVAETEAKQESHAKLISAEAEVFKSESLSKAAKILADNPGALQLRYLQSLDSIGQVKYRLYCNLLKISVLSKNPITLSGPFQSI